MFRYLMILFIFLACSYLGYYFGNIFKNRSSELKEVYKAITLINSEVLYASTPIPIALMEVSGKVNEPIKSLFSDISRILVKGELGSVYEAFLQAIRVNEKDLYLNEADLNILSDFFRGVGESGTYGQQRIIDLTLDSLNSNLKEAYDEFKVNTKMYRTLGVCIGAMLAIFFI